MKLSIIAETTQRQPTSWSDVRLPIVAAGMAVLALFCAASAAHGSGCSTPPQFTNCGDVGPIECTGGLTLVTYSPQAESPCNPGVLLNVTCVPPSGSGFRLGTTNVTCTAILDGQGTCTFNVTVVDTTPPTMGCTNGITTNAAPGQCSALVGYVASAFDVCGIKSLTCSPPGTVFPVGMTTVTCTGVDSVDNSNSCSFVVTVNATAPPASVACSLRLFSQFDMDGITNDNHVLLPDSGPVQVVLTVTNTGPVDLLVTIDGLVCELQNAVQPLNGAFPVAAGQSEVFGACFVDVVCPDGTNLSVTVHGTVVGSTVPCMTATSTCTASVSCQSPVGSRVTGGGVLLPGTVDQSCIEVRTTIFPATANGLTVIKVTHGGQLGAPFGHMGCGGIPGDPCIRGQWQHTRQYKGKANPRDVFDMKVSTINPKGVFDSLQWACLGCCDPATGAFIPPVQVGSVCNPDDHEVCGPQPRPAPANAIIYSGIAKITPTTDSGANTKAAEWVIVRVYIEDRSEPGGFHPEGAVEPADIYCLQAWKTGIKVSKKPDYSTISILFRQALGQANCDFLTALRTGALPIGSLPSPTVNGLTADIQDCGPLASGNEQIHPSTSATCTPSLSGDGLGSFE